VNFIRVEKKKKIWNDVWGPGYLDRIENMVCVESLLLQKNRSEETRGWHRGYKSEGTILTGDVEGKRVRKN